MEAYTGMILDWIVKYGWQVLGAVIILVLGLQGAKWLAWVAERAMKRAKVDSTLVGFLKQIIKFVAVVFVVIAALNNLGFRTTSLVAVLGAASLAVGLSIQSQLSSLAAGMLILIFRPFKQGDFVEAGGVLGSIEGIRIISTIVKSPDGRLITMPNAKIFGDTIINYTALPIRRIDLVVGVSYGDDLPKAKEVLLGVLQQDPRVLQDPVPTVAVLELNESSVDFAVRPWVKTEDFWTTRCDLLEKIKLTLDQEGVSIPFPQRDVHIFQQS